jgi:chromate transporter
MNLLVLYLLLAKAVLMSFSGLGSLPMVRQDFVVDRHVLTDHQLNTAVVAGRTGPGPYGLYVVCVGYLAAGIPGAIAGFLALISPAFFVILIMRWLGRRAEIPRVKAAIRGLLLAAAGLLLSACMPLTADALSQGALARPVSLLIVCVSFGLLTFTKIDSAWMMGGAAIAGLATLLIQ